MACPPLHEHHPKRNSQPRMPLTCRIGSPRRVTIRGCWCHMTKPTTSPNHFDPHSRVPSWRFPLFSFSSHRLLSCHGLSLALESSIRNFENRGDICVSAERIPMLTLARQFGALPPPDRHRHFSTNPEALEVRPTMAHCVTGNLRRGGTRPSHILSR